jgi:hypothetical protein
MDKNTWERDKGRLALHVQNNRMRLAELGAKGYVGRDGGLATEENISLKSSGMLN